MGVRVASGELRLYSIGQLIKPLIIYGYYDADVRLCVCLFVCVCVC